MNRLLRSFIYILFAGFMLALNIADDNLFWTAMWGISLGLSIAVGAISFGFWWEDRR